MQKISRAEFAATVLTNPYIPHKPTIKQAEFLVDGHLEVLYGGAAGGGKLLPLDEVLPTPTGWIRMGDVSEGDTLFDECGNRCVVTCVYDIVENPVLYRLYFDDGTTIDACEDHLWYTFNLSELAGLTRKTDEWRANRRDKRQSRATGNKSELFTKSISERNSKIAKSGSSQLGKIRTTREIVDTILHNGRTNHAIPVAQSLDLPRAELPIDPYLFGLWLGDGHSNGGMITSADDELTVDWIKVPSCKYGWRVPNLTSDLRKLGVLNNKHVPDVYFRGSHDQRLALLQGLMDTDGTVSDSGSPEFDNTNESLVDAVIELACSLGHKPGKKCEGRAKLNGKDCGAKWSVKWKAPEYVFRLKRKRDKQKLSTRRTTKFRYILKAEPVESRPGRCISVSSESRLYLAGRRMVPTHNSIGLLMAALMYVSEPEYSALLLRRTYQDLALPDAIMDVADQWLINTDAHWNNETKTWAFPSGATLTFGYLQSEKDKYRYQGAKFNFVGFDELTQFPESQYTYLFSRIRRKSDSEIPSRMRASSNPGGIGHSWVKDRFITGHNEDRLFIPAGLVDNPYLDHDEYINTLAKLDPVTQSQLRDGNWDIANTGEMFKQEMFADNMVDAAPKCDRYVRFWDCAATEDANGKDPDWTVGVLMGVCAGTFYVIDVQRIQKASGEADDHMARQAAIDGKQIAIREEQEGGSAGKKIISIHSRGMFSGYDYKGIPSSGDKTLRAKPFSSACYNGNVKLVRAAWNYEYIWELTMFPQKGVHDDQVDASSGAYNFLTDRKNMKVDLSSLIRTTPRR